MTGAPEARVAPELAKATTRVQVLTLAVGAASSCWTETDEGRVFDSAEASRIVDAALEHFQRVDTVPMGTVGAMARVQAERTRQIEKGYTPNQDDVEGPQHLMEQVQQRVAGKLWDRQALVEAAATLLATIEWFDRREETTA